MSWGDIFQYKTLDEINQPMYESEGSLYYKMENHKDNEMRKIIEDKLGFNIKEYNRREQEALKKLKEAGQCDSHECDNIPSPFEKLSLEELEYLREHNYFLD